MSENVSVLDYLVYGLCESVTKDEQGDGIDISAGLLGQETSDWIRSVANGILLNKELILKQAEQIKVLHQSLVLANDWLLIDSAYNGSPVHHQITEVITAVGGL